MGAVVSLRALYGPEFGGCNEGRERELTILSNEIANNWRAVWDDFRNWLIRAA